MRISSAYSWSLVVIATVASAVLWRELQAERRIVAELRAELGGARAAVLPADDQPVVAVLPAAATTAPAVAGGAENAAAELKAASATLMVETGQRQAAMLSDPEFRKARIVHARSDLSMKWPHLKRDLGLTDAEADALFNLLAEDQLAQEIELTNYMASAGRDDEGLGNAMARVQNEHRQQQKDALVALLGPERYADFEDYERTTPSRDRVNNISMLMAQAGIPMTPAQTKSFTELMVGEQRRRLQIEADLPPGSRPSTGELLIESDQRVLKAAGAFMEPKQLDLLRDRFEQMAARQRAVSTQQRVSGGQ